MKRIYVAGSYDSNNLISILNNIRIGTKKCAEILKNGDAPFCPWLDFMFQFYEPSLTILDYQEFSLAWLKVADELWVLPNSIASIGTNKEIAEAIKLQIPVIYLEEADL